MEYRGSLRNFMGYLVPYKGRIFLAIISSILNKVCDIVPEILIGIAIDVIVNQQNSIVARIVKISDPFHQLYLVAGLTAILWILESIFEYCYLILWRGVAQEVQHSLRMSMYNHMQNLDTAYFEDKKTGGLLAIINDDINQLELFLSEGPNAIIQLVVNVFIMGAIFTYFSPVLALLTLLPVPFVLLMAFYFQKRLAHLYEIVRERVEKLSSHIASRLIGIMTIKSYATEDYEFKCLSKESLAYTHANYAASSINAAYIPLVRMGILCGFIMSLLVGGRYALQGTLSLSFYSVLVFLTQRFLWPFTSITTITDMYERAMACARRIFSVLYHRQEIIDGSNVLQNSAVQGSIVFDKVTFSYQNGIKVFDNLSFVIPSKKTVAFVGTTGSGKSTIIKLILRFYDIVSGAILIDNNDIKSLRLQSLRQAIALVSQEVYLIDASVSANIAYGYQDVTEEAIIRAAKMAQAHDFIMSLPQGYNSLVGENGKNLSGGQRQRISIARAILKNPSIFIFDEATSALDNETEIALQHSMKSLTHEHTMIIIAHRLSTIRHADIIFVLEKGAIIESGTHHDLLHRNGAYATLWKIQTGEIM